MSCSVWWGYYSDCDDGPTSPSRPYKSMFSGRLVIARVTFPTLNKNELVKVAVSVGEAVVSRCLPSVQAFCLAEMPYRRYRERQNTQTGGKIK